MKQASFLPVLLILALGFSRTAGAQPSAPSPSPTQVRRGVEPRADQELRKMSEFLAKLPRFALEAEETFDEIPDGQPKTTLTNVRRIAVVRPNHLAADATGDTLNRAFWYDGKTASALDKEPNVYATFEAPSTIDATLDKIEDEYGVVLPLADVLYADPYSRLSETITYGRYLGIHLAAGVPCHHLVFSQETIEWQIWIDAGDEPLPRKIVISYVHEPGEPQYSATIKRWKLKPTFPEDLFTFEAPDGARRVDPQAMKRPAEGDKPEARPVKDAGQKGGRQ